MTDLSTILAAHRAWLRGEEGGRGAHLRGAHLRDAYLRDADLSGADLRDADLRGADLRDADLRGADLAGADLANVQGVTAWNAGQVGTGHQMFGVVIDGTLRIWAGCWSGTAAECRANLTQPDGPVEYRDRADRDALIADALAALDRIETHCTPKEDDRG